jgi:hypothetical protein
VSIIGELERHARSVWLAGRVVWRSVVFEVAENHCKPGSRTSAATLDSAFGNTKQPGSVGNRITVHVYRHHSGALFDSQPHQCAVHRDRCLDLRGPIGHRINVIQYNSGASFVAAQPVQTGIDHDAMQPAADSRVMAKRSGVSVRREHRVLERIRRVLRAAASEPRNPVQLSVMPVEQLLEGIAVARDVRGQQFGVAVLLLTVLLTLAPEAHRRTVTNQLVPGTSPDGAGAVRSVRSEEMEPKITGCQDAACTVISEMAATLLPLVVPSVEIHTSRCDVGDDALTGMLLWPGCTDVG